ncbi:hypothetical protein BXY85_3156 [Roseivirga pacifica]|uniref:Lipoprotein n=1 Tax=Roseivirga pacifica TaxID=1267423 RepID=A0A1I0QU63_9BACT|nr:hypothetical protein [Roseivirga pacifica]MCO6357213.1 hypothetical protein [Roseivirga pacifica]MCO6368073.1 hypothetical protein [Roseivirga pacifica]MCO6369445.1 hypothetical protein [Roseivirga pacifica]MCO6373299.1 hypothetical protein [Roseivirga pacifica]MCO6377444.1 hypothetical protein [Roseivirga pacifica]
MKTTQRLILLTLVLFSATACLQPPVVYEEPTEGRLLLGATVHLGNGEFVENAALGVKDGYVTLLADDALDKLDLRKFQVDRFSSDYHIYPFKKMEQTHSGIVLARADGEPINIAIRTNEVEKCITIGCEAQLLICKGSIADASQFRVDYVVMGNEKVKILQQSDYNSSIGPK